MEKEGTGNVHGIQQQTYVQIRGQLLLKRAQPSNRIPNADNTRTLAAQTVNALLLVIIEIKGKSKGTVLMFET